MRIHNAYVTEGGTRVEDWGDCIKIRHTDYLGDITIRKKELPEIIEAFEILIKEAIQ